MNKISERNKSRRKYLLSIYKGKPTHFYIKWSGMLSRCKEKEGGENYENYGARGIKVVDSLHDFNYFCKVLYLRYCTALVKNYKFQKTIYNKIHIDRIDNNHGYYISNIRFVTQTINNQNRRKYKKSKKDWTNSPLGI